MKEINYEEINEIWAYVTCGDEGEGLIAATFNLDGKDMYMPFVCADKERMEALRPHAKEMSRINNKKVKLIKFHQREDLEDIE